MTSKERGVRANQLRARFSGDLVRWYANYSNSLRQATFAAHRSPVALTVVSRDTSWTFLRDGANILICCPTMRDLHPSCRQGL
jgi:hypothetical protein